MRAGLWTQHQTVLWLRCPYCNEGPGMSCRNRDGYELRDRKGRRMVHGARIEAAK